MKLENRPVLIMDESEKKAVRDFIRNINIICSNQETCDGCILNLEDIEICPVQNTLNRIVKRLGIEVL